MLLNKEQRGKTSIAHNSSEKIRMEKKNVKQNQGDQRTARHIQRTTFFKSFRRAADPDRHLVPSRHFLPLPSKYEESSDRREERHLKTGHSSSPKARKNRYTDKFRPPYNSIESTLSTSPHFGNAGKPRPNRQRQLKVTRTKSHQCVSNERWNHNPDKHLLSTNDDPKPFTNQNEKLDGLMLQS